MMTDRDHLLCNHLERFSYTTIEQLEKIFFRDQQYSYNIARRRLLELKKNGYVKVLRDLYTNRNIYCWDDGKNKVKPPSASRMKLLDVYAECIYQGFVIERFEFEKEWLSGDIRSDAVLTFVVPDILRRYNFFVEVQIANHPHDLEKYNKLYQTHEAEDFFNVNKDKYPRILFISDRQYKSFDVPDIKVIHKNMKLEQFATILV